MTPNKKLENQPLLVFKGKQVEASYHDEISIYSGNPCIKENISTFSHHQTRKNSPEDSANPQNFAHLLEILVDMKARCICGYQAFKEAGYIFAATEHLSDV